MTVEESHNTFSCHAAFIAQLQRIPMHPFVVNIDRARSEIIAGDKKERSTRDWISTLRLPNGNPMQCDVENGGSDKRAYVLVPTKNLEQAKAALGHYRDQLRQAGALASRYHCATKDGSCQTGTTLPPRPTEIYVPTAAVLKNLQRMKMLSSVEIWQTAPSTIRTSPRTQQHTSHYAASHTAPTTQVSPPTQQNNQPNNQVQRRQKRSPGTPDVNVMQTYATQDKHRRSSQLPEIHY